VPTRRERIQLGIAALRDVIRALRATGATKRSGGDDGERSAMFDLAALADRLSGFTDDQTEDDWDDFWLTSDDVQTLRTHVATLATTGHSLAAATMPSLRALADTLDEVAQRIH
jgi:hypothetical protein